MENQTSGNRFELSIKAALGIILMYNIILGIIGIPFTVISETMYSKTHEIFQAVVIVLGEIISSIIVIILIIKNIRRDGEINFKVKYIEKFNFKLLVCVFFLILGYFLWYQSSIGIITEKIPVPQYIEEAFQRLSGNPCLQIISDIIGAPIFEEILMRGIILEGLLNKYEPRIAIIASACMFGAIHLNIPQFINAALGGLMLGVIYYKTRSLILCIAMHMSNNAIADVSDSINLPHNIISFFIGIVIFTISVKFIIKYIERLDGKERFEVEGASKNIT